MNPLVVAAVAGVGGYFVYKKLKGPTASDYQSMNISGVNGVPIKIATPVSGTVTIAQATATPGGLTVGTILPVPTTIPGKGITYAPPGTLAVDVNGQVLQPAPIIVTQTGSSSVAIGSTKDVQHALNTLGYCNPPLVEDGKLGPLTMGCIKAFQSKNNLVVDGNAGPATKAALSASLTAITGSASGIGAALQNTPPQSTVNTAAAINMTTKEIQHTLNLLGASPPLNEDGKLGPKSVAAIKSFQTAHGLTSDGIAGPKTKTALYMATTQAQPQGALTGQAAIDFLQSIH